MIRHSIVTKDIRFFPNSFPTEICSLLTLGNKHNRIETFDAMHRMVQICGQLLLWLSLLGFMSSNIPCNGQELGLQINRS